MADSQTTCNYGLGGSDLFVGDFTEGLFYEITMECIEEVRLM